MNEPPMHEPPRNTPPGIVDRLREYTQDLLERARQPGSGARAMNWSYEQLREFVAGVRFMTTIPVPGSSRLFDRNVIDARLVIGSAYFPIIGLLLGLLLCLIPLIFGASLPAIALAALVVVGQVLLTGGLHLDGLMDSCDGLFGGGSRESKLDIMRDSRVGSFGVLAAICVLLLKVTLFSSLATPQIMLALLIVLPTARAVMILAVAIFPNARPSGLGISFRQTITLPRLLFVLVISLFIALIFGHIAGLIAWVISCFVAFLLGLWVTRSLGGLTGDIYGAIVEVCEVVALLLLILAHILL